MLYGFQLWFYNRTSLLYLMKIFRKMQRRAAIWILGAFRTSPTDSLEAIAGLISIKLHLQKLANRSQLQTATLLEKYLIKTLMDNPHSSQTKLSTHSINMFTECQKSSIKGHLIDSNNKLFGVFPSFSLLSPEFIPESRIVDVFSDRFLFNLANKDKNNKMCIQQLDNMTLQSFSSPNTAIIITDVILLNSGNTQVTSIGDSTSQSTKSRSCSILNPYSLVNYLGIYKNPIVTASSINRK